MKRMTAVALGLLVLVAQGSARADIALLITTDSNLSDNGGVDQFAPIAPGASATVYIWGIAAPSSEAVGEFNFDVNNSGSSLSFSNATIGSVFSSVDGSISEINLNDLQFGWSKFFGAPASVPTGSYTLFATVDVAVAVGATPGPDTTIELAGPDFTIKDAVLAAITTTGTTRDLAQDDTPPCVDGSTCDDGNACTTGDTCSGGVCVGGSPPDCDDGNVCTDDSCDPALGCQSVGNTAACDDSNACTTNDTCSDGACVGGSPPNCDDGNVCTDDSCDSALGCQQVNNTNLCDDSEFCTGVGTCDGNGNCLPSFEADCNENGIEDSCDLASGSSLDLNGDEIPDECCLASTPPVNVVDSPVKNRYLSVTPGNAGVPTAIRVTLSDLPSPFDALNGTTMWLGQPSETSEASGVVGPGDAPTSPSFWTAPLGCTPFYTDWGGYDAVQVFGPQIVPNGQYLAQAIHAACADAGESEFSVGLELETNRWGDIVGVCEAIPCTDPDGDSDFDDISAVVDKFRNLPGAPLKARADVVPDTLDHKVDFGDIPAVVDGFRGLPYPYLEASGCP